ncbi:MAG: helix-turn-helix transcriptional regulator [Jatrophihabitantaceae bacterium]
MPRSVTTLVGRSAELATLVDAVRHAQAGQASVVVLDGDAGVGKTRVLTELLERARDIGALPLIGHCVDLGDAPPPYLPFTEAFARLAAYQPAVVDGLRAAFGDLGRLLPRGGELPGAPGDRADRGELFEAVVGAITSLAQAQPVLFIVEDLHWADQATRDLLGFLFTRLTNEQVAIVASFRSDDLHRRHPLRPTLAQWSRLPAVERVHLDPLGADDVRALVRGLRPGPMAESEVRGIITRADGNAFFAEELVAAAGQYTDPQQLPWQLADLLLVRLDRLSEDGRELVRVAAVGGRRVSHELLASVVELPGSALDTALRDAVDAHILEPTPSGRGYTFRHALLAEAIYDDLLPGERVRIHAAYAAALKALASRGMTGNAELARHSRASHDLATAYDASLCAGEQAMGVAAPQEAMQHYLTALEIVPQLSTPPEETATLIFSMVDAAVAAGRPHRALRLAQEALDALPESAPPMTRARLLYATAFAGVAAEGDAEALRATTEAVQLIPKEPRTVFRAHVAALHARLNLIMGREVEAERWARMAADAGRALNSAAPVADAETTLAVLARRVDDPIAAAKRLTAVSDEAHRAGETAAELRSRYNLGSLYYELGELDLALQAYTQALERAREVGRPWTAFGLDARVMLGVIQHVRGQWDAALCTVDVSGEAAPALAEATFAATAMQVRAGRGDQDAMELFPALRPWWEQDTRIGLYSTFAALDLYEQNADVEPALALLDELVSMLGAIWQDSWFLGRIRLSAQGVAVVTAAQAGTPQRERATLVERARQLVEDGRTSAEKGLPAGRRLGVEGIAWLARLEAEWARLRWLADIDPPPLDEHIAAWAAAVEGFGYGNVIEQARSRARYAAVLRAAGRGPEAAAQADLARAQARELKAEPLLAEIRTLGLSAAPRPGAGESHALTDREREVLALLVDGRTNRQIAQRLYISEKTVSVHVSNILAKLKVRSRNEAAALARRDGLLA